MSCATCNDTFIVIVAGPDSDGMYDATDCPVCSRPGYCPHGVWVGGIGIDWMCGLCEDGQ